MDEDWIDQRFLHYPMEWWQGPDPEIEFEEVEEF